MSRHRKLTRKFAGFPMFKLATSGDTFPVTSPFTTGFTGLETDQLALDLQFAADKTLTARKGPTPVFTRGSTGRFVGSNGLIQSAAINTPRFDHDPVTGVCKGLLIEEARTNNSWYSGAIVANTGWLLSQVTSVVDGASIDGGTAYLITEDSSTNTHSVANTGGATGTAATSVVSGTTYTGSIFVKKSPSSVDWVQLTLGFVGFGTAQYANFNLSTGAVGNSAGCTARIEQFSNGWYRCSVSTTAIVTTTTSVGLAVFLTNNTNPTTRALSYAGNTANKILASMCQFETGSFATSYIPTVGSSAIRSADVCSITGSAFSGFYNNTQGTLVTNAAALGFGIAQNPVVSIENGTTQVMRLRYVSVTNRLSAIVSAVGLTPASNYDVANTFYKAALSAGATGADFVINGTQIPDTYTGSVLTADNMKISQSVAGVTNTCVASIRYYQKRLAVSKLQSFTV